MVFLFYQGDHFLYSDNGLLDGFNHSNSDRKSAFLLWFSNFPVKSIDMKSGKPYDDNIILALYPDLLIPKMNYLVFKRRNSSRRKL